jgi:hypothetical protein
LVRQTEENLAWPVLPQLAAKRTLDCDGLEGEFIPARGHIAATPLALHDEDFPA